MKLFVTLPTSCFHPYTGLMSTDKQEPKTQEQEAELSAELEEVWQEESVTTAAATETADEVDGELGTREGA